MASRLRMGSEGQSESTTPYCCRNSLVTGSRANGSAPSLVRRSSEGRLVVEVRLRLGTSRAWRGAVAAADLQPPT
jgi:hypothetical protein